MHDLKAKSKANAAARLAKFACGGHVPSPHRRAYANGGMVPDPMGDPMLGDPLAGDPTAMDLGGLSGDDMSMPNLSKPRGNTIVNINITPPTKAAEPPPLPPMPPPGPPPGPPMGAGPGGPPPMPPPGALPGSAGMPGALPLPMKSAGGPVLQNAALDRAADDSLRRMEGPAVPGLQMRNSGGRCFPGVRRGNKRSY